jgi:hypothetical protein
MASESEGDGKHIIQAVGSLGKTGVERVTTVIEAAVGHYPTGSTLTVFEDSMVGDVLLGSFITLNFF